MAAPFQIPSGRTFPAREEGQDMSLSSSPADRRTEPRIDVRIPIRFRPITEPASAEQSAESVNISRHGLCFFTTRPLRVGEEVEIYLRMPRELSQDVVQVRWNARVVHIEPNVPANKIGVGVHLERLSPLEERESWVC
jgi:c-di-GMP-binding flagellar brake protein YcgR